MSRPLAKGWAEIELGEHVYIAGRIGWRGLKASEYTAVGPMLLSVPNLNVGDEVNFAKVHHISQTRYDESPEIKLRVGDSVLVKDGAGIGKLGFVAHLPEPATVNSSLLVVRPANELLTEKYLFYYLKGPKFQEIALERISGSATPHLFQKDIKKLRVIVPPYGEQRRIVAKLEKLLDKVEASQHRLAKIPVLLKRFRQSVLAAAGSGRLTADWREEERHIESAAAFVRRVQGERKLAWERECVKSANKGKRKPQPPKNNFISVVDEQADGLPERWCATRIGDISDCLDHIRVPINKAERFARQGVVPYYGANGQVGWIDDFLFDEDLVLVVEDETFIGREKPFSYVIRGKAWVNNHAHVLRPLGGIPAEFLNMVLSYYDFVPLTSGTTGRRKLTQEGLIEAPLRIPPLAEQQEIVRRVQTLFVLADQIEARYAKAKAHVNKLTQSILVKAFRGELVPQDPNDEPASSLLDRIRAKESKNSPRKKR